MHHSECADDIAYAVHDLEDVVARRLVTRLDLEKRLSDLFPQPQVGPSDKGISRELPFRRGKRWP